MAPETESLLATATALSENERLALVERLLDTLPPEACDLADEEWEAELDRRFDEFQRDPSVAVPWEQIEKSL